MDISTLNEFTLRPAPGSPWTSTFLFDNLRLVDASCVPVSVAEAQGEIAWSVTGFGEGAAAVFGAAGQRVRVFDATGRLLADVRATADPLHLHGLGAGLRVVVLESGATRNVWLP